MPTNNENQEGATWPMPKFRFEVDFGNELTGVAFQEVTGMDVNNQSIEYRSNNSPLFSTIKMPGIKKIGHITLKRGVFVADNTFWNWHHEITMNTIKRKTVVIKLLDESNKITMQWTLTNAWLTKITGTDLNSIGNEVAVESMEIRHEGINISTGN
jgi:phage tail-like protein